MHTTKIAIAGFSGKMGQLIARALLAKSPGIEVHGLVRSPDKVDETLRSHPNVHIHQTNSDDLGAITQALAGNDLCICCYLGDDNLMVQGQKTLIDACIAAGVPRYVGSDYSFDYRGLKKGDHPAKDWMLEYTAYLDEKENEGKIKGVHILNGALTEVVFSSFIGYFHAEEGNGKFTFFGTGDEKLEMTTMKDTANFVAEIAMDPEANGYRNVLGDRKSVKELAKVYEEVYGLTPTVERQGSLEDLYKKMRAAFEKEPDNIWAWMGMHYQYYMANGSTRLGQTENERLGDKKPLNVKEFAEGWPKDKIAQSYML